MGGFVCSSFASCLRVCLLGVSAFGFGSGRVESTSGRSEVLVSSNSVCSSWLLHFFLASFLLFLFLFFCFSFIIFSTLVLLLVLGSLLSVINTRSYGVWDSVRFVEK